MAAAVQTWPFFTAVAVLVVQLCTGETSCAMWSTAGPVVLRGSSFKVYCTFKCKCKDSMCRDHPPTGQSHEVFNSTTVYFNVVNITMNQTYSCQCDCPHASDSCGMDIFTGYPPDCPNNISCINKVIRNKSGIVVCSWNRGRDTYLTTGSVLWMGTPSGEYTSGPVTYSVSSKGIRFLSASFTVSSSVQLISVWVKSQNPLGSAESIPINYTLSDIVMPSAPDLGQPVCSSRECSIHMNQSVWTQIVEIQYRSEDQAWISYLDSRVQLRSAQVWSISSLQPYRMYHFRARSRFSTGLWSRWSTNVLSWTKEEAPARELDVWYAEPSSDFKSLSVYWKEEDISIARGKITEYKVSVHSQTSGLLFNNSISAAARHYTVPFCADCEVILWACNSKGLSPPARLMIQHTEEKPFEVVHKTASNHSITISWRKAETAKQHAAYVVEWYPDGPNLEELRWIRLDRNDSHVLITGLETHECYAGAVCVVYNDNSVSRTRFTGVTTLESVPAAVPSVLEKVEGNKVKVSWMDIPRGQRGGCITSYTIYLENSSGARQVYSTPASERMHVIRDLSPAAYSLWVTASTAMGEGPIGQRSKVKFFIQQTTQLSMPLVCVIVSMAVLFLMCLYQTAAVKQRVWVFSQCLILDNVPDPANSKWAKECTLERKQGKMKLQLQLTNSTVPEGEEEPILVDVEELLGLRGDTGTMDVSPHHTSPCLTTESNVLLCPLTTYIKSFNPTQSSLDRSVDYISSHRSGYRDEEYQGEENEEEFADTMDFFPSHNFVIEPLEFGGKLTLDAVKIDCGDIILNDF